MTRGIKGERGLSSNRAMDNSIDETFTLPSVNYGYGTSQTLEACWRRYIPVESMTAKPRVGGSSKNDVPWKVEKAARYFVHADKVTKESPMG